MWDRAIVLVSVLVLGSFLVGCQTYAVRAMPQISALEAPSKTSSYEVDFGVKPYTEEAQIQAVFNYDMMSKGVMPVYLVVENHSDYEMEMLRMRVELRTASGSVLAPVSPAVAVSGHGRNAAAEAFWLLGMISYDDANKYNEALKRDWAEKAWPEISILAPGRTKAGFMYFNVGENYKQDGSRLTVKFDLDSLQGGREAVLPLR